MSMTEEQMADTAVHAAREGLGALLKIIERNIMVMDGSLSDRNKCTEAAIAMLHGQLTSAMRKVGGGRLEQLSAEIAQTTDALVEQHPAFRP